MEKNNSAVIYARVSTTRQADDQLPIQGQIDRCQEKAAALGADVVKVFVDEGISGRSDQVRGRPRRSGRGRIARTA